MIELYSCKVLIDWIVNNFSILTYVFLFVSWTLWVVGSIEVVTMAQVDLQVAHLGGGRLTPEVGRIQGWMHPLGRLPQRDCQAAGSHRRDDPTG